MARRALRRLRSGLRFHGRLGRSGLGRSGLSHGRLGRSGLGRSAQVSWAPRQRGFMGASAGAGSGAAGSVFMGASAASAGAGSGASAVVASMPSFLIRLRRWLTFWLVWFGSWLALWLVWLGSWLVWFGSWLAFWLVWFGSWLAFWLVWFGSWLAFWLVWFGSLAGLAWLLAFWLVWLGSGWLSGCLAPGWFGLAPGWLSGWFGLAPGWLSGWFGLALFFFPFFLARLAETQLLGILQAYLGVSILQPHACTQRFRLRILRRTRSNAGRTSAGSLSGRI